MIVDYLFTKNYIQDRSIEIPLCPSISFLDITIQRNIWPRGVPLLNMNACYNGRDNDDNSTTN